MSKKVLTKTYGIKNTVETSLLFKAGNSTVRANFSGGVLDPKRNRPATLTTSNQIAQTVIENSGMFLSGRIFLVSSSGAPAKREVKREDTQFNKTESVHLAEEPKIEPLKKQPNRFKTKAEKAAEEAAKAAAEAASDADGNTYPDVKTIGDAVNVLLDLGVKAGELKTEMDVLGAAKDKGVIFPNLSLKKK